MIAEKWNCYICRSVMFLRFFFVFLFLLLALCLNCKFHFSSWECFYSVFGVNILGILCELFDFILNEKAIICSAAIFVVANGNAQHCDRFDRLSEFHFAYSFGHFPTTSSVHYKIVHHTIFRAVLGRPNCVLCLSDMQLAFGIPFFFAFYFGDFFCGSLFCSLFVIRCLYRVFRSESEKQINWNIYNRIVYVVINVSHIVSGLKYWASHIRSVI